MIPAAHKLKSQEELTVKQETCWNAAWPSVKKPQERESRRNPVHEKKRHAQETRGYYEQFVGGKHIEWKSWIDNDVFDLTDMRKVQTDK